MTTWEPHPSPPQPGEGDTPQIHLSPLLFVTPLSSTLLAAQDVTSARVSFCAATLLVGLVDAVDERRRGRNGPLGRRLARLPASSMRLLLPSLALCSSLL